MTFFDRKGSTPFAKHWNSAPVQMMKQHDRTTDAEVAAHLAGSILGTSGKTIIEPLQKADDPLQVRDGDDSPAFDPLASALGCRGPVTAARADDAEVLIASSWGLSQPLAFGNSKSGSK